MERIKFYADTPKDKNKLFTWELVDGVLGISPLLWRFFVRGWHIRSAWYERLGDDKKVILNHRLDVRNIIDACIDQEMKKETRTP